MMQRNSHRRIPSKIGFALFFFLVSCILLVGQTLLHVTSVTDGWILDGLFPYFILFVIAYALVVSLSADLRLTAIATSVFLVVFTSVPNLKYVFVYGFYDPVAHYGFIQRIISSGFVPTQGFYSDSYGPTPGLHILVSAISVATGLDVSTSMKTFLTALAAVPPLAVYFVAKKLEMPDDLKKIMIVSAAIAFPITYVFSGTHCIYSLYVLFAYALLLCFSQKRISRADFILGTMFGIGLSLSHDVTSFFLLMILSAIFIFLFIKNQLKHSSESHRQFAFLALTFVAVSVTHFIFVSSVDFSRLLKLGVSFLESLFFGSETGATTYYPGFSGLTFLDQARVSVVRFARDAITMIMIVLAPVAVYRLKLRKSNSRFYEILYVSTFVAVIVFFVSSYVRPSDQRGTEYLWGLSPFLIGVTLFWFAGHGRGRFGRVRSFVIISSIILISSLQIFPFQPLIPKIPTSLGSFYVVDWRTINNAYDLSLVRFTGEHDSRMTLAVVAVTRWQIYGVTDVSFQSLLTWDDPTKDMNITADLILVSLDPNVHPIASGRLAIEYYQRAQNMTSVNGILYNNGESCLLLNLGSR